MSASLGLLDGRFNRRPRVALRHEKLHLTGDAMPCAQSDQPGSAVATIKQMNLELFAQVRGHLAIEVLRKASPKVYAPASHR